MNVVRRPQPHVAPQKLNQPQVKRVRKLRRLPYPRPKLQKKHVGEVLRQVEPNQVAHLKRTPEQKRNAQLQVRFVAADPLHLHRHKILEPLHKHLVPLVVVNLHARQVQP